MYRLLIVDDEQDIADSLFELFRDFDSFDLDVYKAYSGIEAMEWMRRAKIDIVLTDIRMPGMSGLQLMEEIRAHWPECQIIFLTGYNEFDYVYTAIKNDKVRYLLKMEGHEEIVNAVNNAVLEIIEDRKIDDLIVKANGQLNSGFPALQKAYVMDLLLGSAVWTDPIGECFERLNIPLDPQFPVVLISCKANHPDKMMSLLDRARLVQSVHIIFEKYLKQTVRSVPVEFEKLNIVWLVQPCNALDDERPYSRQAEWILNSIKGNLETIQEVCYESLGVALSFVVDTEYADWSSVPEKFESIRDELQKCVNQGIEMKPITGNQMKTNAANEDIPIVQVLLKKLPQLENELDTGQAKTYHEISQPLMLYLREQKAKGHRAASEVYYSVSLVFSSYINRKDLADKLAHHIDIDKLLRADEHNTWTDAADYLATLANLVFELRSDEEQDRTIAVIHKVQKYISNHLGEEISLIKLSEIVHFNPSYLSRLFKQITGNNLLRYINDRRLDRAKELLANRKYKIHEIAALLGFSTAPYFTRFFKKLTGISPQEYRDKSMQ
jgi:two-component system response regulator YesN